MDIKVYKQFTDVPTVQSYYIYDSMCNEEWSELMHNLRELPGGSYIKSRICLSLFIYIPWLLATSGLNTMEAYQVHFIFRFMPGGFSSRSCGIFFVAQFWWPNDIDISQGENNMDFYLVTKPGPGVKNSQDWYPLWANYILVSI